MGDVFDYVIVGGGSAGCVVAARLSEDPGVTVCLLEAGGPDRSVLIHAPAGIAAILPTRLCNWAYETVPQKGLNGRRGYQPRGKTLGGSSSINAMIYTRGHRRDYDHWASLGNRGWAYEEVLPYFRKAENNETHSDDRYHGVGGPLNVAELRSPSAMDEVFIAAAGQLQIPRNPDFNGERQSGAGRFQVTHRDGERCSAAKAYLTPNLGRPNLCVVTRAGASRLLLDGRRAVGVRYRVGGEEREVRARREVVVSAGAFGSPQLLLLSGIGPAEELRRHGLDVVHELPGVGGNLQDHPDYIHSYRTRPDTETFGYSLPGAVRVLRAALEWRRRRTGFITTNYAEAGAFLRSTPDLEVPDLQLHFVVGIVDDHNRKLHLGHGYSCHVTLLRPKSRGSVTLANADPRAAPRIDPNFLAEEEDMAGMVRGFRLQHRILAAPAFDPYRGRDLHPVDPADEEAVRDAIRSRADTIYHPVGTCKMGPETDPLAVVDARLRVCGLDGLRVVDASIMPTLVGGNTNAPVIMIGEKAADMMRADA